MSNYTYQHDPRISGADFEDDMPEAPDLDFEKYAGGLAGLGTTHLLAHVKYWRERALKTEQAARLVVEEWHSFGYDSDALVEHMDALSALIDDEPTPEGPL